MTLDANQRLSMYLFTMALTAGACFALIGLLAMGLAALFVALAACITEVLP